MRLAAGGVGGEAERVGFCVEGTHRLASSLKRLKLLKLLSLSVEGTHRLAPSLKRLQCLALSTYLG